MRIKLGRKKPIAFEGYTGLTFCGCRYFQGALFEPCNTHIERMVLSVGRHRAGD